MIEVWNLFRYIKGFSEDDYESEDFFDFQVGRVQEAIGNKYLLMHLQL